jgi:hypothetical protein
VQALTDTLATAKALLAQAVAEVQTQLRIKLGSCLNTLNGCQDTIRAAMRDAIGEAYGHYAGAAKSVADNLGYIMSAAQQYAAILGYPGVPADIPSSVPSAQATVDLISPANPYLFTPNVPLAGASGVVVPRDVGIDLRSLPTGITTQYPGQTAVDSSGKVVPLPSGLSAGMVSTPGTVPAGGSVPSATVGGTAPIQGLPPIVPVTSPTPTGAPSTPPSTVSPVGVVPSVGLAPGTTLPAPVYTTPLTPPTGETERIKTPSGFTGFIGAGPSTPLPSGCPTSSEGLPLSGNIYGDFGTYQLPLPINATPARVGMYFTDNGTHIYQMRTARQGNYGYEVQQDDGTYALASGGQWTVNGQIVGGYCCDCAALNQPPGLIGPPIEPGKPVETCDSLPANKANWTPWQLANCGTLTVQPQPTAPTGQVCVPCPAPIVNISLSELCDCIRNVVSQQLPVPVDLDQFRAFLFSPDDAEWKRNALDWSGQWLQEFNASDSSEQFSKDILSELSSPTRSDD